MPLSAGYCHYFSPNSSLHRLAGCELKRVNRKVSGDAVILQDCQHAALLLCQMGGGVLKEAVLALAAASVTSVILGLCS